MQRKMTAVITAGLAYPLFHAVQNDNVGGGGSKPAIDAGQTNPLGAPIQAQISTKLVDMTDVSFHFRKDKDVEEKYPTAKGKTKRETFKVALPLLTKAGLIAA